MKSKEGQLKRFERKATESRVRADRLIQYDSHGAEEETFARRINARQNRRTKKHIADSHRFGNRAFDIEFPNSHDNTPLDVSWLE